MQLYPAIDLMSGQAVRLRQGRAEDKTVYSDDPVAVAREWEARGGDCGWRSGGEFIGAGGAAGGRIDDAAERGVDGCGSGLD